MTADSLAEDIWAIVERCRHDTTKHSKDEPCRFCGNICNSWKKLTVHLAKHMEQISMPILPLVEQKVLNADTIISPVQEFPDARKLPAAFARSPSSGPMQHSPTTTFAPGIDPFGQYPRNGQSQSAASVMHSYPPPQMVPPPQSGYAAYAANGMDQFPHQTYPRLQNPPKGSNIYNNELQIPNQPYLNMGTMSAVQQQEQAMFTNSPTETTAFPNYFAPDAQSMGGGFDPAMQMQYQQQPPTGTYQAMNFLMNEHNYQRYQGQQ